MLCFLQLTCAFCDCHSLVKYVWSWLWGVHIFDGVCNILGTSYSTWWHMNQRFEADCWKIFTHLLKDDQKQNQIALCKGLQEQAKKEWDFHSKFRVGDESGVYGFNLGTKHQSSQWKSHPPAIRESWGRWSQTSRACCLFSWTVRQFFRRSFFFQCQPVNDQFCGVLRVFMEAVGRKCLTSGIHKTGCCIMTTRHATWIHGFFQCLTKKRWWWYVACVLLHPSLHGLLWFSKIEETWLRECRFKDIVKTKLNRR